VLELRSNAKLLARAQKAAPSGQNLRRAANGNGAKVAPSGESNGNRFSQLSKDTLIKALEKTGRIQAKAACIFGLTPRPIGYALKQHESK
jgi:Nif-specific regulatory protein